MGPFEHKNRRAIYVYEPCKCGWTYDDETLARYARGEVGLDLNPTHACRPNRNCKPPRNLGAQAHTSVLDAAADLLDSRGETGAAQYARAIARICGGG